MIVSATQAEDKGRLLAERLGFHVLRMESGHDLVVPCFLCDSSDAARIHAETGAYNCYSCNQSGGALWLAEQKLGNRQEAVKLLVEVGIFENRDRPKNSTASSPGNGKPQGHELVNKIAAMVNCTGDALRAYGAWGYGDRVFIPMFGPDGKQCSVITMTEKDTKGKYAKGKQTGLFLPGHGRLPKPGETWVIVEGPKDAATLHSLGFLTAGLPGNHMNEKYASLFTGVHVVIVPDLDKPGFEGAKKTATVLMEE